jgi:Ca2+-transporting ATPase
MACATLSFSELLRAMTARSERYPLLRIGLFSNRAMTFAVLSSLLLVVAVLYVPFLQPIFNTVSMGWRQWELILPLIFIPAVAAELNKVVLSRLDARRSVS